MHIRLPGKWLVNPQAASSARGPFFTVSNDLVLDFTEVSRTTVKAIFLSNDQQIPLTGRMRIGNPTTVTLAEECRDNEFGIEIVFYVPPFWPQIDYKYDAIVGTMSIGNDSAISLEKTRDTPIFFSAIKEWDDD